MASLRAPMPSDVLFSTDNVGGEQKIKKVFTPSDVLFSTKKYRWRANEKILVSRSGLSSKRCNAPLLGSQCATGWPPLLYSISIDMLDSQATVKFALIFKLSCGFHIDLFLH